MKHQALTPLLVFIFIGFACTKRYTPVQIPCALTRDLDSIKLHIEGNWKWIEGKTVERATGDNYTTPKTKGYTLSLELNRDTARYFKNGARDSVYIYKILPGKYITNEPQDTIPVIVFFDLYNGRRSSYARLEICSNYLVFHYITSFDGQLIWKK